MTHVRFDRRRLLDPEVPSTVRGRRALALDLAEAALQAVEPERATRDCLRALLERGEALDGATLFAWGKAAVPMTRAALRTLDVSGGTVVAPSPIVPAWREPTKLEVRVGAHPDPAPDAVETGRVVLAKAEALGSNDVGLCLVSGGGSSLLELPHEGVTVAEISSIAARLRDAGADIEELNAVRRALSKLKGGGLGRAIAPARVVNLILSDVLGRLLATVASGPTCPPPEGPAPRDVVERYGLSTDLGGRAAALLGSPAEEPSPFDVVTVLVADNDTARRAVREAAHERGLNLVDRPGYFSGEARALGAHLAREDSPRDWVWGGETTVRVVGPGRGGRNQEVALGALGVGLAEGLLLCFGTDGIDGRSDAAGALVDAHAIASARRAGLDPARFLTENDATTFFDAIGTTLRCGPTSTNVADLCIRIR